MDNWRPIETAPVSTPHAQVYFLAWCPYDDWSPMGNVHVACKYAHTDGVKVVGSNNDRPATHWQPAPGKPA